MNFPDRVPGIPDFTPIFDLIREVRILNEESPHYRHHRPGRLLPCRIPPPQGIRSPRPHLYWKEYVEIDPKYFRPTEVEELKADSSKAKKILNWIIHRKPPRQKEARCQFIVYYN